MTHGEVRPRVCHATKMVVLTVAGESKPDVYLVCSDVFNILAKMLATNQLSSSFDYGPRFGYDEVRLLLSLLGAPRIVADLDELRPVDLWISED